MQLSLYYSFVSLLLTAYSSGKSVKSTIKRHNRNLYAYKQSVAGTSIENLYLHGLSWQESGLNLDQCTEGESQTSNATVLFNFRGRPDDLTDEDVVQLADAFLSAYQDLSADACFEVLDVSIDTSENSIDEEARRMLGLRYEMLDNTRLLQNNATNGTNETDAPVFSFNFSLFFFILFRCFFCPTDSSLLSNDASRRRLIESMMQQMNEIKSTQDEKDDFFLSRRDDNSHFEHRSLQNVFLRSHQQQQPREQQSQQQNEGGCNVSGSGQQQQQQGNGCNNNNNSNNGQQQQQQQQGGGSNSNSSNGQQQQQQQQQDGDNFSESINGQQQQQQLQCSANRLENCKGPKRSNLKRRYNEVLGSLGKPPEAIDEVIDAVEIQKYECDPIVKRLDTTISVKLQGNLNYLQSSDDKKNEEIKTLERALKRTYNALNTANPETCDLQFRRVKRFTLRRYTRLSNNSFSIIFDVRYDCRNCEPSGGLFHNIANSEDGQVRENYYVDFREQGPVELPCTCAIGAAIFRGPTLQEFSKVLQDMINVRKEQNKLNFITAVDSEEATNEVITPMPNPSRRPTPAPVPITSRPRTPSPVNAPAPTSQCGSSSGCCSQNFASCVDWCQNLNSPGDCRACNEDLYWICGEQRNCKPRWEDCTNAKRSCCNGLKCVDVNPFYSQCQV